MTFVACSVIPPFYALISTTPDAIRNIASKSSRSRVHKNDRRSVVDKASRQGLQSTIFLATSPLRLPSQW